MAMSFTLLFVCTANLCRSAMAEQLARRRLQLHPETSDWTVMSAGTLADDGLPMHPHARDSLVRMDVVPTEFRSQQLTGELIQRADLILTAERTHRAAVVTAAPAAVRRTFTIRQFGRMTELIGDTSPHDPLAGRRLLEEARANRSRLQPVEATDDDIADPMGHGKETFRRCAELLDDVIGAIVAPLSARSPA